MSVPASPGTPFRLALVALLASVALSLGAPVRAGASELRRVLLLNSYHPGYQWTDEETSGVLAAMGGSPKDLQVYIEYMGTKWASAPDYFQQLRDAYTTKFKKLRFDVIVATDDDALRFLLEYREAIFGEVPTVFCGVNDFDPGLLRGHQLYTGVSEVVDVRGGLDLALRLHPSTRRVAVVSDSSISGRKIRTQFERTAREYAGRLAFEYLGEGPVEEVLDHIARLPGDSLVFHLVYFSDANGKIVDNDETAALVSRASHVPVYGGWEFSLGHGIVGGKLLTGRDQGLLAGDMARRILAGARIEDIPVVVSSPSRFMFDHEQLRRFGIRRADLPAESLVMNAPSSFYALNKALVWGGVGGLAGLSVVIVLLLVSRARRRRAEETLRASEEKFRTLVENLRIGVYRCSARAPGQFLQANPAMERIFGRPATPIVEVPVADLFVDPRDHRKLLEDVGAHGFVRDREITLRAGNGAVRTIAITASAAGRDERGDLLCIDGTAEDVTDRREMDRRLALADRLASVGTLAAGVAHEINNPLSYILSNLRFLSGELAALEGLEPERLGEARKVADEALEGAERVRRIVLDLHSFARPNDEQGPVDVHRLLDLAINIASSQIRFRARLVKEYGQIPPVHGDETRLSQVALNLLINAAQAIPEGRPGHNEIRVVTRAEATGRVAIEVHDTGCGIAPELRSRVFEPFFTTKSVGAGTGLGLSICHGIVTSLGGEITVESEVGKGSVFRVTLPAATRGGGLLPAVV